MENRGDEATVLTACGIETMFCLPRFQYRIQKVATVFTACGIETLQSEPLYLDIIR